MKKHQIVSLVIFFFIVIAGASCFGQVTFSTFSGQLVDVQFSGKDFNKQATDSIIWSNIKANKAKIQPLLDSADSGAELLWKIDGPLGDIYKEIGDTDSSWIWSKALPGKVSLKINLQKSGVGYINLFQDDRLVGRVRCKSSDYRDREGGQPNQGETKVWRKSASYVSLAGVKMPNSLFIDKPGRMLAIHAGNRLTKSGGCVRVGIFASAQLYKLIPEGGKVDVVWE